MTPALLNIWPDFLHEGKGRRQKKKLVLLGGAHHKVATPPPPPVVVKVPIFFVENFFLLRIPWNGKKIYQTWKWNFYPP